MEPREFVTLVAEMRAAQRDYFRTRSTAALEKSKDLERRADDAIRRMMDDQPRLFDGA